MEMSGKMKFWGSRKGTTWRLLLCSMGLLFLESCSE